MNDKETMYPLFEKFPKIPRMKDGTLEVVITEKLDGTNAQVYITEDRKIFAGSRNRWIFPGDDNYGFAKWVDENKDELVEGLGHGHHYGEWWGAGIQRRYGMDTKQFSLFNTHRWGDHNPPPCGIGVVPVLWSGNYYDKVITDVMTLLKEQGSKAAPGFMKPEGIVIYFPQTRHLAKATFEYSEGKHGKK